MAAKTKFFRVAVEGATADGRDIARQDIEQIANRYNPSTYGARVWLEHLRGIYPDSSFRAYGDVVAVKTEEVEINGEMKLALFAQIDPTQDLVSMVNSRQKIYTSIEIQPNFAKTGEAYLVGLAVTDSPASLGTEMLAFARQAAENPLTSRKHDPENLFTAAEETLIEFEAEVEESLGAKLFSKIMGILGKKTDSEAERFSGIEQSVTAIAESQRDQLDRFSTAETQIADATAGIAQLNADFEAHAAAFKELADKLASQDGAAPRKPAAGGNTDAVKTDC
jgi:uncharacterized membrane protein YdfJ with MMPL/SSD domain